MIKRLHIVHTVCHDQWGGMERRIFHESRWMAARGHSICIIAPGDSPLYRQAAAEGWAMHPMEFSHLSMAADVLRLRGLLRAKRPDVLNTHGNHDTKVSLASALGLGIRCVLLSRHVTAVVRNSWYNRLLYRNLCHRVLTTSETAKRQIAASLGIALGDIRTVSSGIITPDQLLPREEARQALTAQLRLPRQKRFIGFVGRLSAEKGLGCLVEAFAGLQNEYPDHDLLLVGEGGYREALTAKIQKMGLEGRVHLPGYREDIWPLLRALECQVLASPNNEGIPQSLIEAMFARCPVIGTAVGGITELLRHGEMGLLVHPADPADLGEAIRSIIKHPDSALARLEAAHHYVRRAHTIDHMGEALLGIYEEVLAQERIGAGTF